MFIENKKCDPKKIIAVGGSYGGYLTCNLLFFNFYIII